MPSKTSGKASAKSGKAAKAVTKRSKNKRKGKRKESYAIYICKVKYSWSEQHPENINVFSISGAEAGPPRHWSLSCEIQIAVCLPLPGGLAKHAVSEGTKAVTKYTR